MISKSCGPIVLSHGQCTALFVVKLPRKAAQRNWHISRKPGKLPEMKLIETCTLHLLAPTVPRNPCCLPSLQLNPHSRVGFCVYPKALLSQCPVDLKDVVNPQATSAQDFWSFTLTDKSNLGFYEDIPTYLADDFFGAADCFLVIVWKRPSKMLIIENSARWSSAKDFSPMRLHFSRSSAPQTDVLP